MVMQNYNLKYSDENFYWGLEPHKLVVLAGGMLNKSAKVLDLGCGEGKNSFYLAKKGFNVTAVDISEKGIVKLKKFAAKENLKIKSYADEMNHFLRKKRFFDAVFCINALQFLSQDNSLLAVDGIKSRTSPKGFNIISSFIVENKKQEKDCLLKGRHYFHKGELKELYKDWKIIFYEEKLGDFETHGEPVHRHFLVRLIAQKI